MEYENELKIKEYLSYFSNQFDSNENSLLVSKSV